MATYLRHPVYQKALSDLQANDPVVRRRLLCPAKTSMFDDDLYVRPRPLCLTTTSMSGQDLYVRRRPLCPAKTSMFDDDLYLCPAKTSMFDDDLYVRPRPLCYRRKTTFCRDFAIHNYDKVYFEDCVVKFPDQNL